jgi:signal transduction histidine kinase
VGRFSYYKDVWSIAWTNFEEAGKTVDDIGAELNTLNRQSFAELQRKLTGKDSARGTILQIKGLRDDWQEERLDRLFESLRALVPPINDNEFNIELRSTKHPKSYGIVEPLINSHFDYMMDAYYDAASKNVSYKITRNELDVNLLEKKFSGVLKEKGMGTAPFDIGTLKKGEYGGLKTINELIPNLKANDEALAEIGSFSFQIIFAKNTKPNNEDVKKYPYKTVDYRERSEWLKKFGGIRIFRDNFRIRPYGEKGDDWLRLGERQAQSPGGPGQRMGGYRVRPNQVTGSIYISRIENEVLQDKSSREGIVENEFFELLKEIIKGMLTIVEDDRNQLFYALSQLDLKTNKVEAIKQEGKKALADIQTHKKDGNEEWRYYKDEAEKVFEYAKVLQAHESDKDEELRILRSLASAGIITAGASHELKGLKNHMSVRVRQFTRLLEKYLDKNSFKNKTAVDDPFKRLEQMGESDQKIVSWMDYALMPLKRDRRTRNRVKLNGYFEDLNNIWKPLLESRKICLTIDLGDIGEVSVKMFPIDLDTIFNNLIINSMEAFVFRKSTDDRIIGINIEQDKECVVATYEDNAGGLDAAFVNNPERIFLPHVTTKVDVKGESTGTGMGMYLVKAVLDENNGQVVIEDSSAGTFRVSIKMRVFDGR